MFKQAQRISRTRDFDRIFKTGRSCYTDIVGLRVISNDLPHSRYAVVVSNKISRRAVKRSLLKRRIRAALKKHGNEIKSNVDLVALALPAIKDKDYKDIEHSVGQALERLKLV